VFLVDVGEEIERPKKKQKCSSGKQKCHTLKSQLLVEFETGRLYTAVEKGKHDFKLLKRSRMPFVQSQLCLADRGYQVCSILVLVPLKETAKTSTAGC